MKEANDAAIANDMDAVAKAICTMHLRIGEETQGNVTSELKKMLETLRNGVRKTNPGGTDPADDLARIDTMLEEMLTRQRECSQGTKAVFQKGDSKDVYERAEQLQLKSLSQAEGGLVEDAGRVLDLIAKDGDSTVFTPVLKEVQTDLASVQTMLAGAKAGPLTQAIQSDIENTLEKMLAAIREKLAQIHRPQKPRRPNANPNTQPPPMKEPFIPPLAELKLLLTLQKDVNGRTELLDKQANSGTPKDDLAGQNKVLAHREAVIRDMTQKIADMINGVTPRGPALEDRNVPSNTGQFGPI
jgi:hypothetical protein